MVDYVIIDNNIKPIESLKIIKPDFFAKGFEYSGSSLPPATKEELQVIESYGGSMIFTPGDIVYSSSALLNLSEPKIDNLKVISLMNKNKIIFKDLRNIIGNFKKLTVHIVGDTIVDTYVRTNLIGGYTKTPTPSVLYQNEDNYVGGAAIIAQHLKSTGAKVYLSTVLGNDNLKNLVLKKLKKAGVNVNAIIDKTRPTTNKKSILTDRYNLLKIDRLDNQPISEIILKKLSKFISSIKSDVVIFSDFRHGIFNKTSIPILTKSIKKNVYKVADSQVATRWGNITDFKNFDLLTPNEKEARFSLADQDSNVSNLVRQILSITKSKNIILKLGPRGIISANQKSLKLEN